MPMKPTIKKSVDTPVITLKQLEKGHLIFVYNQDLILESVINGAGNKMLGIDISKLINHPADKLVELASSVQKGNAYMIVERLKEASRERKNIYFENIQSNSNAPNITSFINFIECGANDEYIFLNIIELYDDYELKATGPFINGIMETILNNLNAGVTLTHIAKNGEKKYIFFNSLVTQKYGNNVTESEAWDEKLDDRKNKELIESNLPYIIFEINVTNLKNHPKGWVMVHKKQIVDKKGERYIITTSIDITERKREEQNLKQAYKDLELALSSTRTLIWYYDINDDKFHHMLNGAYTDSYLNFSELLNMIHQDDRIHQKTLFEDLINKRKDVGEIVLRIFNATDSNYKYIRGWCGSVKDDDGKIIKIIGTQHDVTEFEETKNKLKEQYNYLQAIYKGLPVGLVGCDTHGFIMFANDKAKKILGIEAGERLEGLNMFEYSVIGKELQDKFKLPLSSRAEIEVDAELTKGLINHKPFAKKYVHIKGVEIIDNEQLRNGFILVYEDVTEKVEMNKELEHQHVLLSTIYNNVPVGIELYDKDGKLIFVNPYNVNLFGFTRKEEILGASIFEEPNINEDIISKLRAGLSFDVPELEYNFGVVSPYYSSTRKGKKYLKVQYVTLKSSDNIIGYLVAYSDITRQRIASKAMENMHKKMLLALEAGKITTWSYDIKKEEFSILLGDSKYKGMTFPKDWVINFISNADKNRVLTIIDDLKDGKKNKEEIEIKIVNNDSSDYRDIESILAIDKHNRNIISGTIHDITEKKQNRLAIDNSRKSLTEAMSVVQMITCDYELSTGKHRILMGDTYFQQMCSTNFDGSKSPALIHPSDKKVFYDVINKVGCGGSDKETVDLRLKWEAQSEYRNYEVIFTNTKDENSKVTHVIGTYIDITDRIKQQLIDREMRTTLELVLLSGEIAVWKYDIKKDKFTTLVGANYIEKYNLESISSVLIDQEKGRIKEMFKEITSKNQKHQSAILCIDLQHNGEYKYSKFELTSLPNSKGNVEYIIGTQKDVTDEIHREQELAKNRLEVEELNIMLQSILDQSPCAMFIKDIDNERRYLMANSYFCEKVNKPFSDIRGRSDSELFSVHDVKECEKGDDMAINTGQPYSYTEEVVWNDKPIIWYSTKIAITTPNKKHLLVGVLLEITEREKRRKELIMAKERAEESDKLKSAFLANMSHEIRTPLNAIVGFSELLADTDVSDEEKQEYLQIITSNNEMLLCLINDVLDLSKMEAGMINLKVEDVDIVTDYEDITKYFSMKLEDSPVKLRGVSPYLKCVVETDRNRMKQIATNFLTNAVKYTKEGHIELRYRYEDNGIIIEVEDTGIGISEEGQKKAFQRFEKLNSFVQGTGLGLSICKTIVESQGGKIGVHSEIGKGSTFWAWIPCRCKEILKR